MTAAAEVLQENCIAQGEPYQCCRSKLIWTVRNACMAWGIEVVQISDSEASRMCCIPGSLHLASVYMFWSRNALSCPTATPVVVPAGQRWLE